MYTRPYTVHSYTKRKENEKEQEEAKKNVGVFTTNETRKEVAKEIKRTHFNLGSAKEAFPQSLSKDTYQNMQVDDHDLNAQQKKMSMINKRSNFKFGRDQSNMKDTTSNQAYSSKQFANLSGANGNAFSANSLRKGNFRLGFNKDNIYQTTAQQTFTDKNDDFKKSAVPAHRSETASLTQMYGYSKPNYQTTNNSNFTEKDVTDSFKDQFIMKQRGKMLKQSNFSFGHFNNSGINKAPANVTEHANKFHSDLAKQNQLAKLRGQELKKSNFKFSEKSKSDNGSSTFKSMAQLQFDEEQMKGDMAKLNHQNNEVSNNLKKDLRSSHFHFGNNEGDKESCSHKDHPRFNIDTTCMEESTKLAKKMQSAHFVLGDGKAANQPIWSTYKDSISNSTNYHNLQKNKVEGDPKKTTIDIGKGKCLDYTSEAKDKFTPHHGNAHTIDKETRNHLNYLKQNHFELGGAKNDFSTINKTDFGAKANPGYKKHHGNIQKTSFVMGFQGNPFNAQTPNRGPPSYTDRSRPAPYQRVVGEMPKSSSTKAANSMQKENFSLGKNGGEFRTMNQAYYRWIQPKGEIVHS